MRERAGFRSHRHCGNMYNWLSYRTVGDSSLLCTFHNVCLLIFGSESCDPGGLSLVIHEHFVQDDMLIFDFNEMIHSRVFMIYTDIKVFVFNIELY